MAGRGLNPAKIFLIGDEVGACQRRCEGIICDQKNGVIPRGLILENHDGDHGAIICGMNPGTSPDYERAVYVQHGARYAISRQAWGQYFKDSPYFARMRRFARELLGEAGPILWTDVAKCEKADPSRRISFETHPQTFRVCADLYLKREVEECPKSWTIIANGRDAFVALAYLLPTRKLIGVPHCTGAYPQFSKLFDEHGKMRTDTLTRMNRYFKNEPAGALWLPGE